MLPTGRRHTPSLIATLVVALLAGACSSAGTETETEEPDPSAPAASEPDTQEEPPEEPAPEPCRHDALEDLQLIEVAGPDPAGTAELLAARTHDCAHTVVLAPHDDGMTALLAVTVALDADAPLLLHDPDDVAATRARLDALRTDEVITVGMPTTGLRRPGIAIMPAPPVDADAGTDADADGSPEDAVDGAADGAGDGAPGQAADGAGEAGEDEAGGGDGSSAEDGGDGSSAEDEGGGSGEGAGEDADTAIDLSMLALLVAEQLETERFLAVAEGDLRSHAAAATHTDGVRALLPIPTGDTELEDLARALPSTAKLEVFATSPQDQAALTERLLGVGLDAEASRAGLWPAPGPTTWLGDPRQGPTFAAAMVAALGRGEPILPIDAGDLRSGRADTARLREASIQRTVLVGETTEHAAWQLRTVAEGTPLPAGGFRLFEDERIVALYGHPGSAVLGVLGEQGLDATIERARGVAAPYGADGARVTPALEIITTIASAEAGNVGDYSRRTPIDTLRPWVERAAEEDMYVILDLQPGRTDFLTQAQEYEELLREPHVGLALDPEWRLGPDQFHLRQIGSVSADEVQQVADWLAELTRDAGLPEKLLVLHQFRFSMLPNRDDIVAPPELAVVVHMDGQGPISTKYDTYGAITAGVEDRWLWGWKNFYDEDLPTPTPEQVLALDPVPVLVTYQ